MRKYSNLLLLTLAIWSCSPDSNLVSEDPSPFQGLEIDSISPQLAFPGEEVTIYGQGLSASTCILLGDRLVTAISGNDRMLTFIVPGAHGTVPIRLVSNVDTLTIMTEFYARRDLRISSVSPLLPTAGEEFRIKSPDLSTIMEGLEVILNGEPQTINSITDSMVVIELAPNAVAGSLQLRAGKDWTKVPLSLAVLSADQFDTLYVEVNQLPVHRRSEYHDYDHGVNTYSDGPALINWGTKIGWTGPSSFNTYEFTGDHGLQRAKVELSGNSLRFTYKSESPQIYDPHSSTNEHTTDIQSNSIAFTRNAEGDLIASIAGSSAASKIQKFISSSHSESPSSQHFQRTSSSIWIEGPKGSSDSTRISIRLRRKR